MLLGGVAAGAMMVAGLVVSAQRAQPLGAGRDCGRAARRPAWTIAGLIA